MVKLPKKMKLTMLQVNDLLSAVVILSSGSLTACFWFGFSNVTSSQYMFAAIGVLLEIAKLYITFFIIFGRGIFVKLLASLMVIGLSGISWMSSVAMTRYELQSMKTISVNKNQEIVDLSNAIKADREYLDTLRNGSKKAIDNAHREQSLKFDEKVKRLELTIANKELTLKSLKEKVESSSVCFNKAIDMVQQIVGCDAKTIENWLTMIFGSFLESVTWVLWMTRRALASVSVEKQSIKIKSEEKSVGIKEKFSEPVAIEDREKINEVRAGKVRSGHISIASSREEIVEKGQICYEDFKSNVLSGKWPTKVAEVRRLASVKSKTSVDWFKKMASEGFIAQDNGGRYRLLSASA